MPISSDPNRGICVDEDDTEPEEPDDTDPVGPDDIQISPGCSEQQIASINKEVEYATLMANVAKNIMPVDNYYKALFSQKSRDAVGFETRVQGIYSKVSDIFGESQYTLAFRCFDTETGRCAPSDGGPTWAVTDPVTNVVTLCPAWFNENTMDTKALIDECKDREDEKWEYLYRYKLSRGE